MPFLIRKTKVLELSRIYNYKNLIKMKKVSQYIEQIEEITN